MAPSPPRAAVVIVVAALALLGGTPLIGCGRETEVGGPEGAGLGPDTPPPRADLSYLDELAHLGYIDNVPDVDGGPSGVVQHDPERAWDGVNFYVSLPDSAAFLMDMDGEVLRSWRGEAGRNKRWSRVELLPDGDVLCIAPKENELLRLGWDGAERWRLDIDAHHDLRWTPEGEILLLTRGLRRIPAVHATRFTVDNSVARLGGDGTLLAEHSLYDLLSTDPTLPIEAPAIIEQAPPQANVDPIHANTLEPVRFEHLEAKHPMYAPGNVLLTLRYTCAVALVNLDQGRVLWSFGPGVLEGPHDATLLENGHVLVLDNGWAERGYSRVLEIDPLEKRIVWEYRAPEPSDFYTSGRGTVQPLPNGNVLVGNSNSGEAFEVTREGERVWRFLNPNRDAEGHRGVLRIRRFPRGRIDALRSAGAARGE